MSGDSNTDKESNRSGKLIKTVTTLLTEIINENNEEFKNYKETGINIIT